MQVKLPHKPVFTAPPSLNFIVDSGFGGPGTMTPTLTSHLCEGWLRFAFPR